MAVKHVRLMAKNATLGIDDQYRTTYTHDFEILTDNDDDLQVEVYNGAIAITPSSITEQLPAMNTPYNVWNSGTTIKDGSSFLRDVKLKRKSDNEQDRRNWIATLTWKAPDAGNAAPPEENPLDDPIKYSLEWANYTRLVDRDKDGNPIINSAGFGFDPPIEIDDARPVLVAIKNMDDLNDIIALAVEYKNAVNTDTFYDATYRKAKVESIVSGQIQLRNDIAFYAVTFRIQFNDDLWDKHLVDRGRQCLVQEDFGTGYYPDVPRVQSGEHAGDPLDECNLNTDGTQRSETLPGLFIPPLASDGFRIYPEKAFAGLSI